MFSSFSDINRISRGRLLAGVSAAALVLAMDAALVPAHSQEEVEDYTINVGTSVNSPGGNGISDPGDIGIIQNNGTITGGVYGIVTPRSINDVFNTIGSTITGGQKGIFAAGSIGNVFNAGTITGGVHGIDAGSISIVHNDGTIRGYNTGIMRRPGANVGATITNAGTIAGGGRGKAINLQGGVDDKLILKTYSVLDGDVEAGAGTDTLELQGTGKEDSTFDGFENLVVNAEGTWTLNQDLDLHAGGAGTTTFFKDGESVAKKVGIDGGATRTANINSGILNMLGALKAPGGVTVAAGATLAAHNTITADDVTVSGTLSPLGSGKAGTLPIAGNLNLGPGSTLAIDIAADGSSDVVVVSGQTALGASNGNQVTLSVRTDGIDLSNKPVNTPILVSSGGILGDFGTITVDNQASGEGGIVFAVSMSDDKKRLYFKAASSANAYPAEASPFMETDGDGNIVVTGPVTTSITPADSSSVTVKPKGVVQADSAVYSQGYIKAVNNDGEISGEKTGVGSADSIGTVTNRGTITAGGQAGQAGISAKNGFDAVRNELGARIAGNVGIQRGDGSAKSTAITNAGTIEGTGGTAIDLKGTGDDELILQTGSVLTGDVNVYEGTDTLELRGEGNESSEFVGFERLVVNADKGSFWTLRHNLSLRQVGKDADTGDLTINSGILAMRGALEAPGGVTVAEGGSLFAYNTITGDVTVEKGGRLSPFGSGKGTLPVTGDLVLKPGSTLVVNVDNTANNPTDVVAVTGNVALGGTLAVTLPDAVGEMKDVPVITATGAVTGDFTAITVNGKGQDAGFTFTTKVDDSGDKKAVNLVIAKAGAAAVSKPEDNAPDASDKNQEGDDSGDSANNNEGADSGAKQEDPDSAGKQEGADLGVDANNKEDPDSEVETGPVNLADGESHTVEENERLAATNENGIDGAGAIGTVTNKGAIIVSGRYAGHAVSTDQSINTVDNSGAITAVHHAITAKTSIGTVSNSGTITAGWSGIKADSIGTVTNTASGSITGKGGGAIFATQSIGTVTNAGTATGITGIERGSAGDKGTKITNAGTIAGTGDWAISLQGSGDDTLILQTGSVLTGDVNVFDGTDTLELQDWGNEDSIFDGFENLVVKATGTWTLTGDLNLGQSGKANINSGILAMQGALKAQGVTVAKGGTLAAYKTITGAVEVSGTLSPFGSDIGKLDIAGTLTLEDGSTLAVNVDNTADSSSDVVAVTGFVTLGGTLAVTLPTDAVVAMTVPVITSETGFGGEFETVTVNGEENAEGFTFAAKVDDSDDSNSLNLVIAKAGAAVVGKPEGNDDVAAVDNKEGADPDVSDEKPEGGAPDASVKKETVNVDDGESYTVKAGETIKPSSGNGIAGAGAIDTVTNKGTINGVIAVYAKGSIGTVTNTGSVFGEAYGIKAPSIGTVTNTDPGKISGTDAIYATQSIGTVTNTGTITGAKAGIARGSAGNTGTKITNAGTIQGNDGTAIELQGSGDDTLILQSGSVLNGNVDVSDGTDTLELQGTGDEDSAFKNFENLVVKATGNGWTLNEELDLGGAGKANINSGILAMKGALKARGGVTVAKGATLAAHNIITGAVTVRGTLEAHKAITGAVTVSGTLSPFGSGKGTLNIDGGLTLKPGSTLAVNVDNTAGNPTDVVAVNGAVTLGGTLAVTLPDDSVSAMNVAVITATGAVTGGFTAITVNGKEQGENLVFTFQSVGKDDGSKSVNLVIAAAEKGPVKLDANADYTVPVGATIKAKATDENGIAGAGAIGTVTNKGTIIVSGKSGKSGHAVFTQQSIDTVNNSGDITAAGHAIYATQSIGAVTNSGTITAGWSGIRAKSIGTVTNTGAITGGSNSIAILAISSLGSVDNRKDASITGSTGIERRDQSKTGTTITNAGTIAGRDGTAIYLPGSGDDTLILQTGSVLTGDVKVFEGTDTLELQGEGTEDSPFKNFENLVVKATGTWTLTEELDLGGTANINSGILAMQGALKAQGGVTVAKGGTLAAYKTITGAVTVEEGGTLSPFGSGAVGILPITGDLTLEDGSTLAVDVGANKRPDMVTVTGDVTLGGTLAVTLPKDSDISAINAPVITATGTVTGGFKAVTVNGEGNVEGFAFETKVDNSGGKNSVNLVIAVVRGPVKLDANADYTLEEGETISAPGGNGITGAGAIGAVVNDGAIKGVYGITGAGAIGTVTNSGTITGDKDAIIAKTSIGTVTNSGAITAVWAGIRAPSIGTVTNSGTITGASGIARSKSGNTGTQITNAGTIAGTGGWAINLEGPGDDRLILQTGSVLTGNVDVYEGTDTLELQGEGPAGGENSAFKNFENLVVDATGKGWTLTETLGLGPSGKANINSGILAMQGALMAPGGVTVAKGATLAVHNIITGAVTVRGTLEAHKAITGAVTVESGGALSPLGSDKGTLNIDGGLTLEDGSTLAVNVDNTDNNPTDVVAVTGDVTLGGTLAVTLPTGTDVGAMNVAVITATGAVTGDFTAITVNGEKNAEGFTFATEVDNSNGKNSVKLVIVAPVTLGTFDIPKDEDFTIPAHITHNGNRMGTVKGVSVGTVTNKGTINGSSAVYLRSAKSVINSGTITASDIGLHIGDADTVINSGTITSDGRAVFVASSVGTLTNSGTITSKGRSAAVSGSLDTLTNTDTGTITGGIGIFRASSIRRGILITNAGTIEGTGGTAIDLRGPGNDRLFLQTGSVLKGNVDAGPGTDTLRLQGTGPAGGEDSAFKNFEHLVVDAEDTWTLDEDLALLGGEGAGTANINSGILAMQGALSAPGGVTVAKGGTLAAHNTITGAVTVSGTLSPFGSGKAGTLPITGALTLEDGSTLAVDVAAGNPSDVVAVTGDVTLGGTLAVTLPDDSVSAMKVAVITATGAIKNAFKAVTVNDKPSSNGFGFGYSVGSDPAPDKGQDVRLVIVGLEEDANKAKTLQVAVDAGRTLTLPSDLDLGQSGKANINSGILAMRGALKAPGGVTVASTLAAYNAITGAVAVKSGGTLSPFGSETGELEITGALTLEPGSTLAINVAADGSSDVVAVSGAVALGGTLAVTLPKDVDVNTMNIPVLKSKGGVQNEFAVITVNKAAAPDGYTFKTVTGQKDNAGYSHVNLVVGRVISTGISTTVEAPWDNLGDIEITESGNISVEDSDNGIFGDSIRTLTNAGSIRGGTDGGSAVLVDSIGTVTNSGTITADWFGIRADSIGTVTNTKTGTISSNDDAVLAISIGTVINSGTIAADVGPYAGDDERGTYSAISASEVLGRVENRLGASISGGIGISRGDQSKTGTTITNAGTIEGTGGTAIDLEGTGDDTLILQTGSVLTGDVDVYEGTDTLELQGTGKEDSAFTNFENLVVDAEGTWTLDEDLVLLAGAGAGTANINSGILAMQGALSAPGGVTVAKGATLAAHKAITGAVTVEEGGTLSPLGSEIGQLDITGDLTLKPGSTLAVNVDNTDNKPTDLVVVDGDVTLGGTLAVTLPTGTDVGAMNVPVIAATGAVGGRFTAVTVNGEKSNQAFSFAAEVVTSNGEKLVNLAIAAPVTKKDILLGAGADYTVRAHVTIDGGTGISTQEEIDGSIGTVTNRGTIKGGKHGIYAFLIDTVENDGGTITGEENAVSAGSIKTVINSGTITGGDEAEENGIYAAGFLGRVENRKGASISGNTGIGRGVSGKKGITTTITNAGTIEGTGGTAINLDGTGDDTLILQTGSVLNGNVNVGAGTDTLELQGEGPANGEDSTFTNFEKLVVDATDKGWTLNEDLALLAPVEDTTGTAKINSGILNMLGALNAPGGVTVAAGATLAAHKTITGAVTVGGTLSPFGSDIGKLDITGDLTLEDGSTLAINVAADGSSDVVAVTGDVTLGGTLAVTLPAVGAMNVAVITATGTIKEAFGTVTVNGIEQDAGFTFETKVDNSGQGGSLNLVIAARPAEEAGDGRRVLVVDPVQIPPVVQPPQLNPAARSLQISSEGDITVTGERTTSVTPGDGKSVTVGAENSISGGTGSAGINAAGSVGTVKNAGSISGSEGIRSANGITSVENTGTIRGKTGIIRGNGAGASPTTVKNAGVIEGTDGTAIDFQGTGDDRLVLQTGSDLKGNVKGGLGNDVLELEGTGSEDSAFEGFEGIEVNADAAGWTLSGSFALVGAGDVAVNTGLLNVNGVLTTPGGVTVDKDSVLGGTGTVTGSVTVNGRLSPGLSPGTLTMNSLVFGETGSLEIEANRAAHDRVVVTGKATLGGARVDVVLSGGVEVADFEFLDADTLEGTFGSVVVSGGAGALSYDTAAGDVRLQATRVDGLDAVTGSLHSSGSAFRQSLERGSRTNKGFWIEGMAQRVDRGGFSGGSSHEQSQYGASFGGTFYEYDGFALGGGFGIMDGSVSVSDSGSEYDSLSYYGGVSGVYRLNDLLVTATGHVGMHSFDSSRVIQGGGAAGGEEDALSYGLSVETGYAFPLEGNWSLMPYVHAGWQTASFDGFTETGSKGVRLGSRDVEHFLYGGGSELSVQASDLVSGWNLESRLRVGYAREDRGGDSVARGTFLGTGEAFSFALDQRDDSFVEVGYRLEASLNEFFSVHVSLDGAFGEESDRKYAAAGISYKW